MVTLLETLLSEKKKKNMENTQYFLFCHFINLMSFESRQKNMFVMIELPQLLACKQQQKNEIENGS